MGGHCGKVVLVLVSLIGLGVSIYSLEKRYSIGKYGNVPYSCSPLGVGKDLTFGSFTLVVSLVGLSSVCVPRRLEQILLEVYSWMLLVMVLGMVVLLLACLVASVGSSWTPEGNPRWLGEPLVQGQGWESFTACMSERRFCAAVPPNDFEQEAFSRSCCELPSTLCADESYASTNSSIYQDCLKWNETDGTCYQCDQCKRSYLNNFEGNMTSFVYLVFVMVIVFSVGMLGMEKAA